MRDVKAWLQTSGIAGTEDHYVKAPAYPYFVYSEKINRYGADMKNNLCQREINLELYTEDTPGVAERRIEALLDAEAIPFEKSRYWIASEKHLQSMYSFTLIEKG